MTGILGLFFGLLEPLVEAALETALQGTLDLITTLMNPLLGGLALSVDRTGTGVPLRVDLPIDCVCYDVDGLTIGSLRVRQTTAPAVVFSTTGDAASLHIGNQRLTFVAEPQPGTYVPVLDVGVTAYAGLTITIDPVAGTLTITPGALTLTATVGGSLAGTDASGALGGIGTIFGALVPLISQPLNALPLPFTGFGGGVVEVSVPASAPSMLVTWLDVPQTPRRARGRDSAMARPKTESDPAVEQDLRYGLDHVERKRPARVPRRRPSQRDRSRKDRDAEAVPSDQHRFAC